MKKGKTDRSEALLPEYDFRGGIRGKHARRYAEGTNLVILDPDVARCFPDSVAVNSALRVIMSAAALAKPTSAARRRNTN